MRVKREWIQEELEGVEGVETVISIHYVRKKTLFNKRKDIYSNNKINNLYTT